VVGAVCEVCEVCEGRFVMGVLWQVMTDVGCVYLCGSVQAMCGGVIWCENLFLTAKRGSNGARTRGLTVISRML
jgi:hypothetical protein